MKRAGSNKELYQRLRSLPWHVLWNQEVPLFNQAPPRQRFETVSVIRAVGVVFSESGPAEQKALVKQWLLGQLQDSQEKVRRYAVAALIKIGVGAREEAELLSLLQKAASAREGDFVAQMLSRIGGSTTLSTLQSSEGLSAKTVQKVTASAARHQGSSAILLQRTIPNSQNLIIHLRVRSGLEALLQSEVEAQSRFRILHAERGLIAMSPLGPVSLSDVFALRCFGTMGLLLGKVSSLDESAALNAIAEVIASATSQQLLAALTDGPIRYRLAFIGKGHQRGAVQQVANRAFSFCPTILNDAREAPWAIDIHPAQEGISVELRPRLSPDPRFQYRLGDVPAASHPPLSACMARLAGPMESEYVWDPFCGSGVELIERSLLGGVRRVYGTDLSDEAIGIAKSNFSAARLSSVEATFICSDFRLFPGRQGPPPGGLTLIISNPPLGKRVSIPNLRGLYDDLFAAAARMLRSGGRLVLINPFPKEKSYPSLALKARHTVDMGGFDCHLELYEKR